MLHEKGVMATKHVVTIVYRECSAKDADSILDSQDKDRQSGVLTCSLNCLLKLVGVKEIQNAN